MQLRRCLAALTSVMYATRGPLRIFQRDILITPLEPEVSRPTFSVLRWDDSLSKGNTVFLMTPQRNKVEGSAQVTADYGKTGPPIHNYDGIGD